MFWPTNAEAILCANYGNNWQEPDPKWVSFISEPSIRYDTALATYYAYQQIRSYWFKSDMMATHKSLVKALERCPNNTLLLNALSAVKPIYNELLNKGTL